MFKFSRDRELVAKVTDVVGLYLAPPERTIVLSVDEGPDPDRGQTSERFTREWNAGSTPFKWVKTADQILTKAVRKSQAGFGAGH
jgi:hypothetical protein